MRQNGILAAAGLIAIEKIPALMHKDHEAAKILAEGLAKIKGIRVTKNHTNFVFFELTDESPFTNEELEQKLEAHNPPILCKSYTATTIRFVTHQWITPERAHIVVEAMTKLFAQ